MPLEGAAIPFVRSKVRSGTVIQADYGTQWERLHLFYPMKRVNHSVTYSAGARLSAECIVSGASVTPSDMGWRWRGKRKIPGSIMENKFGWQ